MSRIGKSPITIPQGVEVNVANGLVTVKGKKGTLTQKVDADITVAIADGIITLSRPTDHKRHRSLHGLYRALIANMIKISFRSRYRKHNNSILERPQV